jgi:hypothetical protein
MSVAISAGCADSSSTAICEPLNFRLGGSAFTVGQVSLPLFQQGNLAGISTRVAFSYHIAWQPSRKFFAEIGKAETDLSATEKFL